MEMKLALDEAKKNAAAAAVELIQADMLVGLGTGSTTVHFIDLLAERCRQGLKITAVASSQRSLDQAKQNGIHIIDIDTLTELDIVVDGADEIDEHKRMIKGGGGALLREKIIASMCKEMVVIVDESKVVKQLGKFPLAIEITPFAWRATIAKLNAKGFEGKLRVGKDQPYITDGGHYIYDICFAKPLSNPEEVNDAIRSIPGVLETGFFFNLAKKVIIGYADGKVKSWN